MQNIIRLTVVLLTPKQYPRSCPSKLSIIFINVMTSCWNGVKDDFDFKNGPTKLVTAEPSIKMHLIIVLFETVAELIFTSSCSYLNISTSFSFASK